MTTTTLPKKPWYQSKIILLALSGILVFGTNLLNGWLTGQGVTQDQLDSLTTTAPTIVDTVQRISAGESILNFIGIAYSAVMLIFRKWFTSTMIG